MKEYQTLDVEEALAKYVTCDDTDEKNKIFNDYLFTAIKKLIDDIFERYHLPVIDNDVKLDVLCYLVIHMNMFNPNAKLQNGKKISCRVYCSILIRSWIANYKLKTFREKQNICFEECHEIYLNKIQ